MLRNKQVLKLSLKKEMKQKLQIFGKQVAALTLGTPVFNPAFDVTPHGLITGIITEKGILVEIISKKLHHYLKK